MQDKEMDQALNDVLLNNFSSQRLIKESGIINIPGTPIILPGRGVTPNDDEYVDTSNDTAVTNDDNKIEALKAKNMKEVIENQMLGSFDKNGIYKISDEISQELIDVVKVINSADNTNPTSVDVEGTSVKMLPGVIYCQSASAFNGVGNFKFAIQTYYRPPVALSELFLLEDIKKSSGVLQNVNIYSVGKFKAVFGSDYKRQMFQYFNIVSKETALKMTEEEKLLFGWAYRRKLYFQTLLSLSDSKYLIAEANYLTAKLEALATLGAFGTQVLATFNELKERAQKIIGKELTARDLNDLLDIVVDQLGEKYPEMNKQYYAIIIAETKLFHSSIKLTTEQNTQIAKEKVKKIGKTYRYEYKTPNPNSALKVYVDKGIQPKKRKNNTNSKPEKKPKKDSPKLPKKVKPPMLDKPSSPKSDTNTGAFDHVSNTFNQNATSKATPKVTASSDL